VYINPNTPLYVLLTYVDGGLLFVSSQDPDLNVGFHEGLDGLWYFVLKFVFNGCGPQQLQVLPRKKKKKKKRLLII